MHNITTTQIETILHFCIMRFESGLSMPADIRQIILDNFNREDFKTNGVNAGEFISWLVIG